MPSTSSTKAKTPTFIAAGLFAALMGLLGSSCGSSESGSDSSKPASVLEPMSESVEMGEDDGASVAGPEEESPASSLPVEPSFASEAAAVFVGDLGDSWREGCPVRVEDLRRLTVAHWDDTGAAVTGELVVHVDHVDGLIAVFGELFDARFPIHAMRPITEFGGDDDASMAANNTSAFNCREIDGSPGTWSRHAFGGAIDINPLVNPWVRGDRVDPPGGAAYVDRDLDVAGLIRSGDVVTTAFASVGWGWGGDWSGTVDYQHFSANGR